MKLFRSLGWTSIATLFNVIGSFSIYKLFSVYFGPPGLALTAHIQNLISINTTLPHEGINSGIVKYLSGKAPATKEYNHYFFPALGLQLVLYMMSLPVLYLLFKDAAALPPFVKSNAFFMAFAIASFFHIGSLFLFSLLLSAQLLRTYALISIVNTVLGLLLIYIGVVKSEWHASIALLFAPCCTFVFLVAFFLRRYRAGFRMKADVFNKPALKDLGQFLFIALGTLVFGKVVDFFVRVSVMERFDLYQTGLWQSAVKLSDGYTTVVGAVLGMAFFPGLSAVINRKENVKQYFMKFLFSISPFIIGGLVFVYIFKEWILTIVFESSFSKAALFLDFQLLGDAFKFPSWIMVYVILAQAKTRLYLFLQFVSALAYVILLLTCTHYFGMIGVSYAYVLRFVLYFFVVFFIFKKHFFKNLGNEASFIKVSDNL